MFRNGVGQEVFGPKPISASQTSFEYLNVLSKKLEAKMKNLI